MKIIDIYVANHKMPTPSQNHVKLVDSTPYLNDLFTIIYQSMYVNAI